MAISLTHYQVVEDASDADGTFMLYPREASQPTGLERFSAHAQFESMRGINWPQTFALRQLRYSDYERVSKGTVLRACFQRKPSADAALPEEVVFERKPRLDAALQGEVLTYPTEELVVHARLCGSYRFADISSDVAALLIDRTVFCRAVIANLATYCVNPAMKAIFMRDFIDSWDETLSFVRGKRM
jgi:hypothetical protein